MLVKLNIEYPPEKSNNYTLDVDYQLEGKYIPGTYFIPESYPEVYISSLNIIEKDGENYTEVGQIAQDEIDYLQSKYEWDIVEEIESRLGIEDYINCR